MHLVGVGSSAQATETSNATNVTATDATGLAETDGDAAPVAFQIDPATGAVVIGADGTTSLSNTSASNVDVTIGDDAGTGTNTVTFADDVVSNSAGGIDIVVGDSGVANGAALVLQGNVLETLGTVTIQVGDGGNADTNILTIDSANNEDLTIDAAITADGGTDTASLIINDSDAAGNTITFNDTVGDANFGTVAITQGNVTFNANVQTAVSVTNNGTTTLKDGVTVTTPAVAAGTAGTLVVGTSSTGGVNSSAQINVTGGAASDFSNQTISFSGAVDTTARLEQFIIGENVLTAGTAGVTDTYLYDFELVADGADTDVTIAQLNTLTSALASGGNTGAVAAVKTVLTSGSTHAGLQSAVDSINSATTSTEVNNLVESILPSVDGGGFSVATNVASQNNSMVQDRLASLRGYGENGMAAGDASNDKRMWGQFFGAAGEQDDRDGVKGYDVNSYGFAFGADTQISNETTVGFALSYADSNVDSDDSANTETEIDTYQLTLYGEHDLGNDTYVSGQLGYAFSENEVTRTSPTTRTFDYDADQFIVSGEVGRSYELQNGLKVIPHAGLNYMHYEGDSYTDTGTGLVAELDGMDVLEAEVGVKLEHTSVNADGSVFKPYASAEFGYDFIGDEVEATGRFGSGANFTTEGFDSQDERLTVGTGFTFSVNEDWDFSADYAYEYKEDFSSHSGLVEMSYNF